MNTQELQKKSFDFIDKNLHVTFDKVPEELRISWIVDDPVEYLNSDYTERHEYAVFMYALMVYHKNKGLKKFEMQINQLQDYFITFQTLLSLAEINAKTDISIKPIKLFDFDNYGDIKAQFKIDEVK